MSERILLSSSNCSNLEWFDISWCMGITENGIRNLAESCPKLTVFKAEGCTNVKQKLKKKLKISD